MLSIKTHFPLCVADCCLNGSRLIYHNLGQLNGLWSLPDQMRKRASSFSVLQAIQLFRIIVLGMKIYINICRAPIHGLASSVVKQESNETQTEILIRFHFFFPFLSLSLSLCIFLTLFRPIWPKTYFTDHIR